MTEFNHTDRPCDWPVDDIRCANTPTAFVGELYYACEEHFDQYRDFLKSDKTQNSEEHDGEA